MHKILAWSSTYTMEVFHVSKSQLHSSDVSYRLPLTLYFKDSKMYSVSSDHILSVILFYVLKFKYIKSTVLTLCLSESGIVPPMLF